MLVKVALYSKWHFKSVSCWVALLLPVMLGWQSIIGADANMLKKNSNTFETSRAESGLCHQRETLTLHSDGKFVRRLTSYDRELLEERGPWIERSGFVVLDVGSKAPRRYRLVHANLLKNVDNAVTVKALHCSGNLFLLSKAIEFSGTMRLYDLFSDRWTLIALDDSRQLDVSESRLPTLQFTEGSRIVTGSAGCNGLRGYFKRSGYSLTSKIGKMSRRSCQPDRNDLERRLIAALGKTKRFSICCGELKLSDGSRTVARFEAKR